MKDRKFRVYWKGGRQEILYGFTFDEALSRAGYEKGDLRHINYYEEIN